jgi:hypothetical protein
MAIGHFVASDYPVLRTNIDVLAMGQQTLSKAFKLNV